MAGPERARHDREHVGKLFAELLRTASQGELQRDRRSETGDGTDAERQPRALQDRVAQDQAAERRQHRDDDELAGSQAHGRGLELRVEPAAEPSSVGEATSEVRDLRGDPPTRRAVHGRDVADDLRPRLPTAAMRSPMIRCCRRRLAVPNSMTPSRNAAAVARPIASASAAGLPQKEAAAVISSRPACPGRRPPDRRTRRALRACRRTSAAGRSTSTVRGTCPRRPCRPRSRRGRGPGA